MNVYFRANRYRTNVLDTKHYIKQLIRLTFFVLLLLVVSFLRRKI